MCPAQTDRREFMKPCRKNRKDIALMVLEELEDAQSEVLVAHLEECKACRGYFEEMSGIATALANTESGAALQANPVFHQRLVSKLRSHENRSVLATFVEQLGWPYMKWRVWLCMTGAAAVAFIGILAVHHPGDIPAKRSDSHQMIPAPAAPSNNSMDPTISNYEMVANHAPEQLDKLLTEQGNKSLSPMPVYRASALPTEIGAD